MDDVFTYCVSLPPKVKGFTVPCADGYTIYLNKNLTHEAMLKTYQHELNHVTGRDFEKSNVQAIESTAHKRKTATRGSE